MNNIPNKPSKINMLKTESSKTGRTQTEANKPKSGSPKKNGFSLRISPLLALMAAAFFIRGNAYLFLVHTVAVILHELAHAEVSQRLGYKLHRFKLTPYGAALTGEFEGVKHRDEVLIALAGPAANIALAIPAVALWWLIPASYPITEAFVAANLFIAAFNILPVFPLDGGRILLSVLSQKMPRQRAYRRIRIIGWIFSGLLIGLFIASLATRANITFAITGVFILVSTLKPDKHSYYQRLYSMAYRTESLKRGLAVKEIIVGQDTTILKLTKMLSGAYFTKFTVMDENFKPLFSITETELEKLSLSADAGSAVRPFKE